MGDGSSLANSHSPEASGCLLAAGHGSAPCAGDLRSPRREPTSGVVDVATSLFWLGEMPNSRTGIATITNAARAVTIHCRMIDRF
jgi:hypothetical protein